jgi:glycopeptide antibiotics resistance protein
MKRALMLNSLLLANYILCLGILVLTPRGARNSSALLWFLDISGPVERALNIFLLMPLPLLLNRLWSKVSIVALGWSGPILSIAIEVAQCGIKGRISDLRDVLLNTLGSSLATVAVVLLRMQDKS